MLHSEVIITDRGAVDPEVMAERKRTCALDTIAMVRATVGDLLDSDLSLDSEESRSALSGARSALYTAWVNLNESIAL